MEILELKLNNMKEKIRELVQNYTIERSRLRQVIRGDREDNHSEKWNKAKFTTLNEVIDDLEKVLKLLSSDL